MITLLDFYRLKNRIEGYINKIEQGVDAEHHRMLIIDILSDAVDKDDCILDYAVEIDQKLNLNVFC